MSSKVSPWTRAAKQKELFMLCGDIDLLQVNEKLKSMQSHKKRFTYEALQLSLKALMQISETVK